MIESVAVAVPFAGIFMLEGLTLQLLSEGKPLQVAISGTLPLLLKPLCDVKVSVVDPDCPGEDTPIVLGLAETPKDITVIVGPDEADEAA